MRFNFKADGTIVKRCDKCGREVCRLIPTGNPSMPITREIVYPYSCETVIRPAVRFAYSKHTEHNVLEDMYYCIDCKQNCELR